MTAKPSIGLKCGIVLAALFRHQYFGSITLPLPLAMTLTIIVAIDRNRGIGIGNRLPWRLPEDLAHFKHITTGHPIIMGRKTFESIGKALPGRRNVVVTRNPAWQHDGVECVASIADALALVHSDAEAFVIGGAEIYRQALPFCTRLVITEIDKVFECDTFLPALDIERSDEHPGKGWSETSRQNCYSELNDCSYAFVTYMRTAN